MAGVPNGSTTPRGLLGNIALPAEIVAVYNAAGYQVSGVAPGEGVNVSGQTVGATPDVRGVIPVRGIPGSALGTGLAATSVMMNGIVAPILYSSSTQTSVVAAYGVAGYATASILVKSGAQTTAAVSIPVVPSIPGVFTLKGGGTGQAVVLNADGTVNPAKNPAAWGTVFLAFVTGEGATSPPGHYAVGAPVGLSGVMEVEGIVPVSATVGNITLIVTVGSAGSQANVTIAVK